MKTSRLIQRLNPPRKSDNPFAFGGGMHNGGLSDDAMDLLRGIFSFDCMGAAEFEWGAVPKALDTIAQHGEQLTAWSSEVIPGQHVYGICHEDHVADVIGRVSVWAHQRYPREHLEPIHLALVLDPGEDRYVPETCGWLELDNGFFFFTDKAMFEATARLFGVDVEVPA